MGFQPYQPVEEVEIRPAEVTKTRKTYWDEEAQCWKNTTIWSVPLRRATENWLKENYQVYQHDHVLGWVKSFQKITMGEKIYLHYCLAKPND